MASILDRVDEARAPGSVRPRRALALSIAVTGANGQVGRALLAGLASTSAHTIALVQGTAYVHASRLVFGPLQSPPSAQALAEADVIVHLAGALRPLPPNSYAAANVETTRAVAHALRHGRARRVLFLSYAGADEHSPNLYLRAKAEAERLLIATGKEVVVFRCTHIIGPPEAPGPAAAALIAPPGHRVTVLGNGRQEVDPLYLGDVAAALLAGLEGGTPGVYELAGPERVTMDELVRLLNPETDVRIRHVPPPLARLLSRLRPSLPPALVDVMLADSVGEPGRAVDTFRLQLRSLRSVWV